MGMISSGYINACMYNLSIYKYINKDVLLTTVFPVDFQ